MISAILKIEFAIYEPIFEKELFINMYIYMHIYICVHIYMNSCFPKHNLWTLALALQAYFIEKHIMYFGKKLFIYIYRYCRNIYIYIYIVLNDLYYLSRIGLNSLVFTIRWQLVERKPLLPTQGIFNLPHHIGGLWWRCKLYTAAEIQIDRRDGMGNWTTDLEIKSPPSERSQTP